MVSWKWIWWWGSFLLNAPVKRDLKQAYFYALKMAYRDSCIKACMWYVKLVLNHILNTFELIKHISNAWNLRLNSKKKMQTGGVWSTSSRHQIFWFLGWTCSGGLPDENVTLGLAWEWLDRVIRIFTFLENFEKKNLGVIVGSHSCSIVV